MVTWCPYISVLARGQSSPLEVHERAMQAVLRYLKTVVHYFQVFPRQRQSHMILRAYVDASWGSGRSVERRSISEGCLMLGQGVHQVVGAPPAICCLVFCRERAGFQGSSWRLVVLWGTSWGMKGDRCAHGATSEAAVNISKMEGLRKLRHIDIRACFIQTEVQAGAIKVFSVKGTENPADIFTKNLDKMQHSETHAGFGSSLNLASRGGKGFGVVGP